MSDERWKQSVRDLETRVDALERKNEEMMRLLEIATDQIHERIGDAESEARSLRYRVEDLEQIERKRD